MGGPRAHTLRKLAAPRWGGVGVERSFSGDARGDEGEKREMGWVGPQLRKMEEKEWWMMGLVVSVFCKGEKKGERGGEASALLGLEENVFWP